MGSVKNKWENVKKNPTIKIQTNPPPKGRKNWVVKRAQKQEGNHSQEQVMRGDNIHFSSNERESFCKGSRSHPRLFDDDYFSTPKVVYQEKVM